jgi:hypothetical protein
MLINILYGLPTILLCLLLQAWLMVVAQRYYMRYQDAISNSRWLPTLRVVWGVMLLLLLGNIAQIGVWALLFQFLEEFADFESAFYHSAVNFSTLGYGDVVMSDEHRLLGPIEGLNGVLMIGVSTAMLMSAFQDALTRTINAQDTKPPLS